MQHIGIEICQENQKIVERSDFNFVDIFAAHFWFFEPWLVDQPGIVPWIETIDPYANTVFNNLQVVYFIQDMGKLKMLTKDEKIKKLIDEIITFASKILPGNVHSGDYLKFIGD